MSDEQPAAGTPKSFEDEAAALLWAVQTILDEHPAGQPASPGSAVKPAPVPQDAPLKPAAAGAAPAMPEQTARQLQIGTTPRAPAGAIKRTFGYMNKLLDFPPDGVKFVPPYSMIMKHLLATSGRNPNDDVRVPRKFLEFLLQCILLQSDFDEAQYKKSNPDVADAIRQKKIASALEHFVAVGYFEDRTGAVPVDENWYLSRNGDVAAAKKAGKVPSGEAQYRAAGAAEWREPNPDAVEAIRVWKRALSP